MQKKGSNVKRPVKAKESDALSKVIAEGMSDKKGLEIVIIDLRNIKGTIADFFVLCTGNSDTHVDAIADSIEDLVYKKMKLEPWHTEGRQNKEWILLDYVDVVANVFKKDSRRFYSLEQLWGDAGITWVDSDRNQVEQ
jgi:ribosome-associated protein